MPRDLLELPDTAGALTLHIPGKGEGEAAAQTLQSEEPASDGSTNPLIADAERRARQAQD